MACALWCLSSLAAVVAIAVVDLVGAAASFKSKVWLNKLIPPSQASPPPLPPQSPPVLELLQPPSSIRSNLQLLLARLVWIWIPFGRIWNW
jgi:hypothetical protein